MKILIIDNYDSFVYNIAQYVGSVGVDCQVVRNDAIDTQAVIDGRYDGIIISPGPGTPSERRYFGACSDIIRDLSSTTPILGVCLGHQGIIEAYGGCMARPASSDMMVSAYSKVSPHRCEPHDTTA